MKLSAVKLRKRLSSKQVLDDVDLECAAGQVVVVMGANGCGKSTLLRILTGIIEPDRGEIRVGGESLDDGRGLAKALLGYVPDASDPLPDLRASELVTLVGSLRGVPIGPELNATRDRLGVDSIWSRRVATMSFGERKRVSLLMALVGDPWLLVLDEPTNGLDAEGCRLVADLLSDRRTKGKGAVVSTHDAGFVAAIGADAFVLEAGHLSRAAARP